VLDSGQLKTRTLLLLLWPAQKTSLAVALSEGVVKRQLMVPLFFMSERGTRMTTWPLLLTSSALR
jgi:hypothetical protein